MKIDLKSAFFGLCLGALVALAVGAAVAPSPSPYLCGRFQVTGTASQFVIIDTTSGQAWLGDFHSALTLPPNDAPFFQPKIQP